jgi:hypothetical protein
MSKSKRPNRSSRRKAEATPKASAESLERARRWLEELLTHGEYREWKTGGKGTGVV